MGYHYTLIRGRSREGCFRAFRHNNWVGLAIFAGILGFVLPVNQGDLLTEFDFGAAGAWRCTRTAWCCTAPTRWNRCRSRTWRRCASPSSATRAS